MMSFSYSIDMNSGRCRMHIDGEMIGDSIGKLREEVLPVASRCREVEVDLSGVSEMDVRGLELMLQAKRVAGGRLRFVGHSKAVLEMLDAQAKG